MKLLVDMPLSPAIAEGLRRLGHDAVHASQVGLVKATDAEILAVARAEDRAVVTADLDFPRLLALCQAAGPALIPLRGGNYSEHEARELLHRVLDTYREDQLARSVVVVDRKRTRRTALLLRPPSAH